MSRNTLGAQSRKALAGGKQEAVKQYDVSKEMPNSDALMKNKHGYSGSHGNGGLTPPRSTELASLHLPMKLCVSEPGELYRTWGNPDVIFIFIGSL